MRVPSLLSITGGCVLIVSIGSFTVWARTRCARLLSQCVTRRLPEMYAVVYDPRRWRITGLFAVGSRGNEVLRSLSLPAGFIWASHATLVHLPHYRVWFVPPDVLRNGEASTGQSIELAVEDVDTSDGKRLAVRIGLRYHVEVLDLPRYLTQIGPRPAAKALSHAVSSVVIDVFSKLSSTVIKDTVSYSRGVEAHFKATLLQEILRRYAVTIDSVELGELMWAKANPPNMVETPGVQEYRNRFAF